MPYPKTRKHKSTLPDYTGRVYTRLTVIAAAGWNKHHHRVWLCRCTCGKELTVDGANLTKGNTKSCGCYAAELLSARRRGQPPSGKLGFGIAARNMVISHYRGQAKKNGRLWSLTADQVEKLLRGNCHYCGKAPSHHAKTRKSNGGFTYNGIDRVDNSKGYELGNVVSCCKRCNVSKNDMGYEEFCSWVARVYLHLKGVESPKTEAA